MKKKRAIKLLMAAGFSRNRANQLIQGKPSGVSNGLVCKNYIAIKRIRCSTEAIGRIAVGAREAYMSMARAIVALALRIGGLDDKETCD